jgi:hypothetical protein
MLFLRADPFPPQVMVKENRIPIVFRDTRGSRIGLLPLGANDDKAIRWFDLPSFMIFHVANAWEEEDGTVKVCRNFLYGMCQFNGQNSFRYRWPRLYGVVEDICVFFVHGMYLCD